MSAASNNPPGKKTVLSDHARHEIGTLHPAILRQLRPHWYPAGLEWSLHRRRESLIEAALEAEAGAVA